jgi:hypothetical protein
VTPPTSPTNLVATGGESIADLTWDASTDDIAVSNYNLHRGIVSGFTPTTAKRVAQPTTRSYMDGGNGGWPILYGSTPVTSSNLMLAFDEDQERDSERSHTTEQVAYIIFGN